MERSISAEAGSPPWVVDHSPGSGFVYRQCADHVRASLGLTPFQCLALLTQDEWHSLLQYAYLELRALGLFTPPLGEQDNGKG